MMRQFHGTPFEPDLRRAIQKLGTMLPDGVSIRLDTIADFLAVLPAVQVSYDPESFCALSAAAVCRRRVEVVYWTASRNETTRRKLDPYNLALVDDGWYAVGYCHLRADVRMFAIQRVKSVRETGETFNRPADFHVEDYMKGSFRAVRGDENHDVILRFTPEAAGWIAERNWHSSQVLEPQPDGGLIVRFHVTDLREIKRWVMAWGAECQALEPWELRDSIVRELREVLRREELKFALEATCPSS